MPRYPLVLGGVLFCWAGLVSAQQDVPVSDPQGQSVAATSTSTSTPPPVESRNNFGDLYYQLQILQQEVMSLRGQLEEQGYQLRQLKQQSLERYVDLDRRLSEGQSGTGATTSAAGATTGAIVAGSGKPATGGKELPGESDAYRSAYSLVRSQQFDDAVAAFKAFLVQYPDGKYAANAHYWLGELYLVIAPADLESSRQAFTLLLEQYPDTNKAPDAMYKLGKVYFQKGNRERAKEYLDRVVKEYGDSGSSAVNLARDFLAANY